MSEQATGAPAEAASRGRAGTAVKLALVIVAAAALYAVSRILPVKEYLIAMLAWIESLGIWSYLVFGLFYILGTVLMIPGLALTAGAGIMFGPIWGTAVVSVSSTLGACAAFLVGRTVARGWISAKLEGNARFAAIDVAVGREGLKIVLLTRLSPAFPFNLLNYGFGLTKIGFWKYAIASWIGMLPGTFMYVYFGSAVRSLATFAEGEEVETGGAGKAFFWGGLVVAIVVAGVVARVARKAITSSAGEALNRQDAKSAEAPAKV